ncbi:hypothetical protein BJF83_06945 [Nocardiopsis sp. CNR-923]|nr:hypothetical protein BJF83_06945 [Nocardiopsis sp. CNR-923]
MVGRVDDGGVAARPALGGLGSAQGQGGDLFALDQDVGLDLLRRGDDQAASDHGASHARRP